MDSLPSGFQLDESPGPSIDQASSGGGASGDFDGSPPPGFQLDEEKYGSTGQQVLAGVEGAAKGLAGPLATYAETKIGVKPEDILGRAEANPWTHGLAEAGGFGAGLLTGTGEAALLGRAGEAAAHVAGLGKAATTGAKLAKGAVTAATEMGLFQAGDEYSKMLLNAPQTPGSVIANIGLSALLGGIAGPAFTGAGIGISKALDSTGMKEFMDRLAFRRANIDPNEMMRDEAANTYNTFNQMNDEISGSQGLKAQAQEKLLPKQLTTKIYSQVGEMSSKAQAAIKQMAEEGVPARYITKFENDANKFLEVATTPGSSVSQTYDAMNDFKRNLQDYSKGNWGPFAIPRYHEAYDFLNITKNLSRDVRIGLEDSGVWGKAADLQKDLNKSWVKALPAAKDFEKKFMVKVGDQLEISQDKFNTYTRAGLRHGNWSPVARGTTDRQALMGNFIDAMDNHFKTVDKLYEAAGVENPHPPVAMGTLKESIERPSLGARLADIWHDKISHQALGNIAGAGIGGKIGSMAGLPLEGVYLGKEILGPAFSSMLKPIMEKYPNVDIGAIQQAMAVAKNIQKGDTNLAKAAKSLIEGAKTFPSHVIPDANDLEKLDEKTKKMGEDVSQMQNVSGKVGYYMPGHETTIAKTAGDAISFINSQRPTSQKALPLDGAPKISKQQESEFKRTLSIAQQPLMAFKHIQDGTLLPQDVSLIRSLYPDYYQKMSHELMSSLTDQVQGGYSVPYHIRQGMSLFLGSPLESSMTQSSIMSAQNVFVQQQAQLQAQPHGVKKNASKMNKISDSYMTANEASIKRRNNA